MSTKSLFNVSPFERCVYNMLRPTRRPHVYSFVAQLVTSINKLLPFMLPPLEPSLRQSPCGTANGIEALQSDLL